MLQLTQQLHYRDAEKEHWHTGGRAFASGRLRRRWMLRWGDCCT
jgi:hypothetical protein